MENVFVLIARAANGLPLTGQQAMRVVEHYQTELNRKNETLSIIRETLNQMPRLA
jgi:hypothetical protein